MTSTNGWALNVLQSFRRYLAEMAEAPLDDLSIKEIAARPVAKRLLLPDLELNLIRIVTTLSRERMDKQAFRYCWHLIRSLESLGRKYGGPTHLDAPPNLEAKLPKPSDLRKGLQYHIAEWAYSVVDDLSLALLAGIPFEERVREGITVLDACVPEWPKLVTRGGCECATDISLQIVEPHPGSIHDREILLDSWLGLADMDNLERSLWLRIHGLVTHIVAGEGATADKHAVCMLWWHEAELRLTAVALHPANMMSATSTARVRRSAPWRGLSNVLG